MTEAQPSISAADVVFASGIARSETNAGRSCIAMLGKNLAHYAVNDRENIR
ncbi:MAG TPA: hypothetical protein VEH30_13460 [Terriglobales bacterium]|nr:hypothetical protein [Terriglobales bacterium]